MSGAFLHVEDSSRRILRDPSTFISRSKMHGWERLAGREAER